ncbi:MAG: DUF3604 domain-containing protein [bacterium]|nr:DUF3604 domain-containing protein [bacterium]
MSVWGVLRTFLLILAAFVALAVGWVLVVGLQKPPADPTLEPAFDPANAKPMRPLERRPPAPDRQAFFGDLHIHTALSADAFVFGVRAMPDDAYRFAKGASLAHGNGSEIRLSKPLDFAAVTDHSEFLGITRERNEGVLVERSLRDRLQNDSRLALTLLYQRTMGELWDNLAMELPPETDEIRSDAWQTIIGAAEQHNDPGAFTTFIAYEWTRGGDNGIHLHRNVIYGSSRAPDFAASAKEARNSRDLWAELDRQREAGIPVLAIPHNPNLSGGLTFATTDMTGNAFDADYIETRRRNEPLTEIFQVKGTSETHPALSPEDEFADFEIQEGLLPASEALDLRGGYARAAQRVGLEIAARSGSNPFDFGVIGSSDGHGAASPIEEDAFFGKLPMLDGTAAIRLDQATLIPEGFLPASKWGAAGLAGIWAEENTRASLFAAMRRKETFATSGPRIRVRMFGGWDLEASLLERSDGIREGYRRGVPMGGTLRPHENPEAPAFLVWALKDPDGANLDRLQIIKGWLDDAGRSHERVYEIAASDGRVPDEAGRLVSLPSTVDVASATYEDSVGAADLSAFWQDPDFDPDQRAFYYARALEIATPRWSTYDAKRLGIPPPKPHSIHERAVGSSIWYEPGS